MVKLTTRRHIGFGLLLFGSVLAWAGDEFEIKQGVIASGGGTSQGANTQVTATIGQKAASQPSCGNSYTVSAGVWTTASSNDVIFNNGFGCP